MLRGWTIALSYLQSTADVERQINSAKVALTKRGGMNYDGFCAKVFLECVREVSVSSERRMLAITDAVSETQLATNSSQHALLAHKQKNRKVGYKLFTEDQVAEAKVANKSAQDILFTKKGS